MSTPGWMRLACLAGMLASIVAFVLSDAALRAESWEGADSSPMLGFLITLRRMAPIGLVVGIALLALTFRNKPGGD